MKFFLSFLFAIACHAEQFSLLKYYPGYYFAPLPENTFAFPIRNGGSFPAFVVRTNSAPQNISGATITAKFRVTASDDAAFTFGGEGRWNTGPMRPHARLVFSAKVGYGNEDGCPKCHWWSADGWQPISNGTFTITAKLDPSRWTDSGARVYACCPPPVTSFAQAAANAMQVGVSFGGGWFYDIGVGLTSGAATFEMLSLEITYPPVTVAVLSSPDLTNWTEVQSFTYAPTNGAGFFRLNIQRAQ